MTDVFTRESAAACRDKSAEYARAAFEAHPETACVIVSDQISEYTSGTFVTTKGPVFTRRRFIYVNTAYSPINTVAGLRVCSFFVWPYDEENLIWREAMKEVRRLDVIEAITKGAQP